MTRLRKPTMAALSGLGAVALLATSAVAATDSGPAMARPSMQLAHMGQAPQSGGGMMSPGQGYGSGPSYGMGPCHGSGAGYGMGPGMMRPGYGYGPAPGYGMGPGMMGPEGSGRGEGYGMAPDMGGRGMMGRDPGQVVVPSRDLSVDDVRHFLEHSIDMHGNKRLKVGEVTETDQHTIVAEIVTQDGSLVQRLNVDRYTGQIRQVE